MERDAFFLCYLGKACAQVRVGGDTACDNESGETQVVQVAPKGSTALIAVPTKVRHGDKVYLVTRRKLK